MTEQNIRIVDVRSMNNAAHKTVDGYDSYNTSAPSELNDSYTIYHKNPRSSLSFTVLASLAFKNAAYKRLTEQEIYSFIQKHFSHTVTTDRNWKSSVRETLAKSPFFMRMVPCKSTSSGTLLAWPQDETGLTWAVNPARIVEVEGMIMRSAEMAGSSTRPSTLKRGRKSLEHLARDGIAPKANVTKSKTVIFTRYPDGVLPLVTLFAGTPSDYQSYAGNYPVKF